MEHRSPYQKAVYLYMISVRPPNSRVYGSGSRAFPPSPSPTLTRGLVGLLLRLSGLAGWLDSWHRHGQLKETFFFFALLFFCSSLSV